VRGSGLAEAVLRTALHVSNGDATDLPGTGLAPRLVYWRDTLHEGPVPDLGAEELRGVRAEFLRTTGADDRGEAGEMFLARDRALEENREGTFVLWFEADLYDQLQIAQVLARLAELGVDPQQVWLICIGEHPAIAHFAGLGQLSAGQLRALASTDVPVQLDADAFALATRAWSAFTAPRPEALAEVAAARSVQLRFLGAAFDRLAQEYPWLRDGLSLTERRLLAAVAVGAATAGDAFVAGAGREARPFLGDTWAFAALERLARAATPLVTCPSGSGIGPETHVELTATGADVLAGAADFVDLNGVDRWIGGVHLTADQPGWRWDDGVEALVRPPR
jgi:hypothetical protein